MYETEISEYLGNQRLGPNPLDFSTEKIFPLTNGKYNLNFIQFDSVLGERQSCENHPRSWFKASSLEFSKLFSKFTYKTLFCEDCWLSDVWNSGEKNPKFARLQQDPMALGVLSWRRFHRCFFLIFFGKPTSNDRATANFTFRFVFFGMDDSWN